MVPQRRRCGFACVTQAAQGHVDAASPLKSAREARGQLLDDGLRLKTTDARVHVEQSALVLDDPGDAHHTALEAELGVVDVQPVVVVEGPAKPERREHEAEEVKRRCLHLHGDGPRLGDPQAEGPVHGERRKGFAILQHGVDAEPAKVEVEVRGAREGQPGAERERAPLGLELPCHAKVVGGSAQPEPPACRPTEGVQEAGAGGGDGLHVDRVEEEAQVELFLRGGRRTLGPHVAQRRRQSLGPQRALGPEAGPERRRKLGVVTDVGDEVLEADGMRDRRDERARRRDSLKAVHDVVFQLGEVDNTSGRVDQDSRGRGGDSPHLAKLGS